MTRTIVLLLGLSGLTACGQYEGRSTNCWSGGAVAFAPAGADSSECTNWIDVSG